MRAKSHRLWLSLLTCIVLQALLVAPVLAQRSTSGISSEDCTGDPTEGCIQAVFSGIAADLQICKGGGPDGCEGDMSNADVIGAFNGIDNFNDALAKLQEILAGGCGCEQFEIVVLRINSVNDPAQQSEPDDPVSSGNATTTTSRPYNFTADDINDAINSTSDCAARGMGMGTVHYAANGNWDQAHTVTITGVTNPTNVPGTTTVSIHDPATDQNTTTDMETVEDGHTFATILGTANCHCEEFIYVCKIGDCPCIDGVPPVEETPVGETETGRSAGDSSERGAEGSCGS